MIDTWPTSLLIIATVLSCPVLGLLVDERNISGTGSEDYLTDKQLAIQRWFAQLSYLQDPGDWTGWGSSVNDVDCDGNTCIRYEIAGLAYAAAVLAYKTPAYTQVVESILFGSIIRMIDKVVWQYVELFDDFKEQSTYPDPVAYKNIMYSGHLAQMIALLEAVTGNLTFSERGWEFVWGVDSDYPTPIRYNTHLLMDVIHEQAKAYQIGGVPCEPDSIFVICNNYPMNAFALHDKTHGSSFSDSVPVWQSTVMEYGVNKFPDFEKNDNNFFNLDYLIRPIGIWEPIGSVGSDVWALSWMKGWWPAESSDDLLRDAFLSIYQSSQWVENATGNTTINVSDATPEDSVYPQSHLHPGPGSAVFPFSDEITTSFYPMLEKQFLVNQGSKINDVYRYFEGNMGRFFDSDGDSEKDSYQYNTQLSNCDSDTKCETGDYSIWATANLLIAMTFPEGSPNFLNEMFHPKKSLFEENVNRPKVLSVDYPHVMVRSAVYESAKDLNGERITLGQNQINNEALMGTLRFGLSAGDNYPRLPHKVTIRGNIDDVISMTLNGEVYTDYFGETELADTIIINAPGWGVCDSASFEFVVNFSLKIRR